MNKEIRSDRHVLESNQSREYIGGGYFNPVAQLEELGRKICGTDVSEIGIYERMNLDEYLDDTYFVDELMHALQERVVHSEWIFGVYQKPTYRIGVLITDAERLIDFERQVIEGLLERRGYYAVQSDAADKGLKRDF